MIVLTWYLYVLFTVASPMPSVNGPMDSKADCEKVGLQMVHELRPAKAACIEVPEYHPLTPH